MLRSEIPKRERAARVVVVLVALLAALPFLVHGPGASSFVVDDPQYITNNQQVRQGFGIPGLLWAGRSFHAMNWHPLTWVSHMLDVSLFGLDARGHHVTSIVLHACVAGLLSPVLTRLTGSLWPSLLVAALFAVHPLRVDSVAWIAERNDVLKCCGCALPARDLYFPRDRIPAQAEPMGVNAMKGPSRAKMTGDADPGPSYPPLGWAGPRSIAVLPTVLGALGVLAGGAAWTVSQMAGDPESRALREWAGAAFAAFFVLLGLRFVLEGVGAGRRRRMRDFQGGTEAWGEGYRWRRSTPALSPEGAGWFKSLVGVLALVGLGVVLNLYWFDQDAVRGSRLVAYVLIPLFTLFVLFILVVAAREISRQLLFGPSRLEFDSWPVPPGGKLRATLRSREPLATSGRASATLSLIEQEPPGAAAGPPRSTVAFSRRHRIEIPKEAQGKRTLRIEIDLPEGQPATNLQRPDGGRRYWVLDVSVPTRGILDQRENRFLVPVYSTAAGPVG